ncbi:MAG: hypothetical protein U1F43_26250 [Myxococcota bacterium]
MVGGTRSNKISSIYDRAAYLTARNGIATWDDYQGGGMVYDLSGAGLFVTYHPNNREAVKQSFLSSVTSSQQQYNVASEDDVTTVEYAPT